jgi:hypothetical protein
MKMSYENVITKYLYSERILIGFISSLLLGLVLELTGIYLLMLLAGFIGGIFVKKGWHSFIIGFLSIASAWEIYFIIFSFVSGKMDDLLVIVGNLIGIQGGIILMLTIIIGGLLGGVGALVGAYITQIILGDKYDPKAKVKLI